MCAWRRVRGANRVLASISSFTLLLAVLTGSLAQLASPVKAAYPGANGRIVFNSSTNDLYSMNADGTGLIRLTFTLGNNEVEPVVSPNAQQIAFVSDVGTGGFNIWVMGIDGSNLTKLTTTGSDRNPTWSPDGTKIAFDTRRPGVTGAIWVMNADGTGQHSVIDRSPFGVANPAWSPDGTLLAYERGNTGPEYGIYAANAETGTGESLLTPGGSSSAIPRNPSWSPDGTKLAFQRPNPATGATDIYSRTIATGVQINLTNDLANNQFPAWSPDGSQITYAVLSGQWRIWRMNADGSAKINASNNNTGFGEQQPDWGALAVNPPTLTPTTIPTDTPTPTTIPTDTPTPTTIPTDTPTPTTIPTDTPTPTTIPTETPIPVVPSVAWIAPNFGTADGGTLVTISGSGLSGVTAVMFGAAAAASFQEDSDSQVGAVAPAGTGTVNVTVTTAGGTSALTYTDLYTFIQPPQISGLSPSSGPQVGGTDVRIAGSNLAQANAVLVDGVSVPFTRRDLDSHYIYFTTPPHAVGVGQVVVTTSVGASNAAAFTYLVTPPPVVSSLSPTSGPQVGGTVVVITGSNIEQAHAVLVDQLSVPFMVLLSTTQGAALRFTTPPHALGVAQVVVTTSVGPSNPAAFTYVVTPAPQISGLSPSTGPQVGGTVVGIDGSNLGQANAVLLDGVSVPFRTRDFSSHLTSPLNFTTPPHAVGIVQVVVITSVGASNPAPFTYLVTPAPVISSLSPTTGPQVGGTEVVIKGSNLNQVTTVLVDQLSVPFTVEVNSSRTVSLPKLHDSPAHAGHCSGGCDDVGGS